MLLIVLGFDLLIMIVWNLQVIMWKVCLPLEIIITQKSTCTLTFPG